MSHHKTLIAAVGFAESQPEVIQHLRTSGFELEIWRKPRRMNQQELVAALSSVHACIITGETLDAEVLKSAPLLRLVIRMGSGLDKIDLGEASSRNIAVTTTPDPPVKAVAELTLGLMLNVLRGISTSDRSIRIQEWKRPQGRTLAECTIGIIGMGRIGSQVARLLSAFGSTLLLHDIAQNKAGRFSETIDSGARWVSLDELLSNSDIVTLHIPLDESTLNLIGERELNLMPKTSILINTSRGEVIDELALTRALAQGHLGGAGLDVFCDEPYRGRLAELDNVVLTAHIGSAVKSCREAMEYQAMHELIRFFSEQNLKVPSRESLNPISSSDIFSKSI